MVSVCRAVVSVTELLPQTYRIGWGGRGQLASGYREPGWSQAHHRCTESAEEGVARTTL